MRLVKIVLGLFCITAITSQLYCMEPMRQPVNNVPDTSSTNFNITADNKPDKVRMKLYSGYRPAIIFVINNSGQGINDALISRIIRLFAENNATVSVAVVPCDGYYGTYNNDNLRHYVNAGVADVSMKYDRSCMVDSNSLCPDLDRTELELIFRDVKRQMTDFYNQKINACVLDDGLFCKETYEVLQETGFKVVTAENQDDKSPSISYVDYNGAQTSEGLFRLPFAGAVNVLDKTTSLWGDVYSTQIDNELFKAVKFSIDQMGIALVNIPVEAFLDNNQINEIRLADLEKLILFSQSLGEVITYSSWFDYMERYVMVPPFQRKNDTPAHNGKPAVIFRLDDVVGGWHEDTVKQIFGIFERNNIPLDIGITPYFDGRAAFEMPYIREYLDKGIIDISMHGYDWTYAQVETSTSRLTYDELLDSFINGKKQLTNYYGIEPVAFTVPNDFFDEAGFNAVKEAGFKIFATHYMYEFHPSTIPVDYNGIPDEHGMYRIPTATDVTVWDDINRRWGEVFNLSKLKGMKFYSFEQGVYYEIDIEDPVDYNDFYFTIKSNLNRLGVTSVGIHPDAFIMTNGEPDIKKLEQLEAVVLWVKDYCSITTFRQWYRHAEAQRKDI